MDNMNSHIAAERPVELMVGDDIKFSIFSPVVTLEHREFYERIIGELGGIFPICNQGKCTAVEISENVTEQEQITDLMKKVETFSFQLLGVTKRLFNQFYQAKEDFCRSIFSNTSYIKINLMDRNLLERTCDVRWWSLETAFGDCLLLFNDLQLNLASLSNVGVSCSNESREEEALQFVLDVHQQGSGVLAQEDIRIKFKDALGCLCEYFGARDGGDEVDDILDKCRFAVDEIPQRIRFACDRLEDINASYTLYRDLVVTDSFGFIIANSNVDNRLSLLGVRVNQEEWFIKAMESKDGTQYAVGDLCCSVVEPSFDASLIYSAAVRENGDNLGRALGAMGIFFDFQGEAQMILDDYMPCDAEGSLLDGWYSFFTDQYGMIIGSSDMAVLPIGSYAHLPRKHRMLNPGQRINDYLVFEGVESAIFTSKTDGYLEYPGLGWNSHFVVPKSAVFNQVLDTDRSLLRPDELLNSSIIPSVNKETYIKIQDDKESIQLISLNGIVFASKLGKRGVALGPIFDQITKTGDFATSMMEKLLAEMAVGELQMNLRALENSSKQAIDLIDRNLFERAADIRWWSTDQYFWSALESPGADAFEAASKRLKVINASYTLYRNLVLADGNGDIVACSRLEMRNELSKLNVSDHEWFQSGMRTTNSHEYAVQDVVDSPLERTKNRSLIYVGGVRRGGAREGEAMGVLGIMFDWDTEAKIILRTCLPSAHDGSPIIGAAAFYTNKDGRIIETTDPENFPVGSMASLPSEHRSLQKGESASGLLVQTGTRYLIGSSRTQGYREYEGLDWCAHIVRPVDAASDSHVEY